MALDRCVVRWRNTWRIRWLRSSCEGTSSRETRSTCTRLVNNWRSRWLEPEQGEPEKRESAKKRVGVDAEGRRGTGDKLRAPAQDRSLHHSQIFGDLGPIRAQAAEFAG